MQDFVAADAQEALVVAASPELVLTCTSFLQRSTFSGFPDFQFAFVAATTLCLLISEPAASSSDLPLYQSRLDCIFKTCPNLVGILVRQLADVANYELWKEFCTKRRVALYDRLPEEEGIAFYRPKFTLFDVIMESTHACTTSFFL